MRAVAVLALRRRTRPRRRGARRERPIAPGLNGKCAKANLDLYADGKLSLATDNLSFPPWWGGKGGHGFDPSDPYSGKGYEGAVSYEIARRLGFAKSEVTWKPVGFNKAIAPGKKAYDAYISQVSYNPARAKVFDFSISYYFVNQAVVGLKGTPITKVKTMKGLKPFTLGAPVGTTSYSYITGTSSPCRSRRSTTRSTTRSRPSRRSRSTGSSSTSRAPATSRASSCRRRPSSAGCPRRARGSGSGSSSRRAPRSTPASTGRWRRCGPTGR